MNIVRDIMQRPLRKSLLSAESTPFVFNQLHIHHNNVHIIREQTIQTENVNERSIQTIYAPAVVNTVAVVNNMQTVTAANTLSASQALLLFIADTKFNHIYDLERAAQEVRLMYPDLLSNMCIVWLHRTATNYRWKHYRYTLREGKYFLTKSKRHLSNSRSWDELFAELQYYTTSKIPMHLKLSRLVLIADNNSEIHKLLDIASSTDTRFSNYSRYNNIELMIASMLCVNYPLVLKIKINHTDVKVCADIILTYYVDGMYLNDLHTKMIAGRIKYTREDLIVIMRNSCIEFATCLRLNLWTYEIERLMSRNICRTLLTDSKCSNIMAKNSRYCLLHTYGSKPQ